jgi:hypothetical protein
MAPSSFGKAGGWAVVSMTWKGRELLQTHRPPGPLQGYLPVSLTCKELAHIYNCHRQGVQLTPEDFLCAHEIAMLASDNYPDEPDRADKTKKKILKALISPQADPLVNQQDSITNRRNNTDGGISRKTDNRAILVLELKNHLGQSGDPVMQLIAYHSTIAAHDVETLISSRHSCLLLSMAGPYVTALLGTWTGQCFSYDYLGSIVVFPSEDPTLMIEQAVFWRHIKDHVAHLAREYTPEDKALDTPGFPYFTTFTAQGKAVAFKYEGCVPKNARVFYAKEEGGEGVFVFTLSLLVLSSLRISCFLFARDASLSSSAPPTVKPFISSFFSMVWPQSSTPFRTLKTPSEDGRWLLWSASRM